ncbi:glycosyltransferase 87 family protein [Amycolatopsis jejuensis]|uniref:glycosyltransferase 87 family protein n=1 Tax=Amycolatopsis jejuensis TaxID=330084 RepID=UPI000A05C21F|nr:glycosyltransferase 87 family protein [Amycolatopsis jejuensis]
MTPTLAAVLRHWLEGAGSRRWTVFALVTAALAGAALIVVAVCTMWPLDLEIYRMGAQALVRGQDLYGPLPPTRNGLVLPFIYPPFAALLFLVFTPVPLPVGAVVMLALSLTALCGTVYVVVRPRTTQRTALLASLLAGAAALAFEPVRETLWFGQINLLLMALVVLDCLGPKTRLPRGVLLGLAAAVKITPAGFLLFFLVKRDFRTVVTTLVTFAAAGLAGFAIAPEASTKYWFGGGLTGASGMSGSIFATNQTIQGALHRFALPDTLTLVLVAVATLGALLLTVPAMLRADPPMAFLLNATAILVCSPISWSHHWVWIVPATILLAARATTRPAVAGLAATAVVFVVAPHSLLPNNNFRELTWGPFEHVVGNSYLLLAVGFLSWQFVTLRRAPITDGWRGIRSRSAGVRADGDPPSFTG